MPIAGDFYYHAYEGSSKTTFPVVLIHGAGGNHLFWPTEIRRLSKYRVLAPDLPGHGKSGGHGQQAISAYAREVVSWMELSGTGRAVVVGHSMGSAVALQLAIEHSESILALGLLGAGAKMRVRPDILADSAGPSSYHIAVDTLTKMSFSSSADPRLVELAGRRMLETRYSVLHGDLLACDAFDVSDHLSGIQQPVLLICGAEDQLTPLRYSQYLAGSLRNSHLEVVPEAGHMVMLEKPGVVADLLLEFLAQFTPEHSMD
jgi:pimeloyl-ACP methyl ester carboxylesterase